MENGEIQPRSVTGIENRINIEIAVASPTDKSILATIGRTKRAMNGIRPLRNAPQAIYMNARVICSCTL